jgi:hypothetical protein
MKKPRNYNHSAEESLEACGLQHTNLVNRYNHFVDENEGGANSISEAVHSLTQDFNKREIAYLFVRSLSSESTKALDTPSIEELVKMSRETSQN